MLVKERRVRRKAVDGNKRTVLGFSLSDKALSGIFLSKRPMPFSCPSLFPKCRGLRGRAVLLCNKVLSHVAPKDLTGLIPPGSYEAKTNGPQRAEITAVKQLHQPPPSLQLTKCHWQNLSLCQQGGLGQSDQSQLGLAVLPYWVSPSYGVPQTPRGFAVVRPKPLVLAPAIMAAPGIGGAGAGAASPARAAEGPHHHLPGAQQSRKTSWK